VAVDQGGLDVGATSWLLISAALVLVMTPGVAFFYGGMVRAGNVLGTIMKSFIVIGIVSVVWVAVGFSLAFDKGNGFVGGVSFAGLPDLDATVPGIHTGGVPLLAFVVFQMMFAIITPALITGAGAERWRFGAFVFFVVLWSIMVYAPVAHWLFSPHGWAAELGALDFAGGAVVHANAGAAALVVAARLGRRTGWPDPHMRPHNLPLMLMGTALLWFGWFGFNGGSALTADGVAAVAVLNTQVAAAAALLSWAIAERVRFGKPTTLGAASGAVAGLVAITPAAGYVTPIGAIAIGALAGVICHLAVGLKAVFRLDDALDVAAVHLGGGIVGALAVGLFATSSVNPAVVSEGLFYGGGYRLLAIQAAAVGAVVAYSLFMTLLIASLANRLLGNRVSGREEAIGLDLSQHGEAAYSFAAAGPATTRAVAPVVGQNPPVDRMHGEPRADRSRADRTRAQSR
jgi:ammonium transporter, Amt family